MTAEELRSELQKRLDAETIARERVRLEWQLNQVSAKIIAAVIKTRFADQERQPG